MALFGRSPHSQGRCDIGGFKVCLAVIEFYYLEEVGALQV